MIPIGGRSGRCLLLRAPIDLSRSSFAHVLGRIRLLALLAATLGLDALAQHI
jgi:hypothetical protein